MQGWLDAGTREKVKVLGSPAKDPKALAVLERYIERRDIPRIYGGELDWEPESPPRQNLDVEARGWLKEFGGVEGEQGEGLRGAVFVDAEAGVKAAAKDGTGVMPRKDSASAAPFVSEGNEGNVPMSPPKPELENGPIEKGTGEKPTTTKLKEKVAGMVDQVASATIVPVGAVA